MSKKSLARKRTLLTAHNGNPKVKKGEGLGYHTYILHLAPANKSGHNLCAFATPECIDLCLNRSGHGAIVKAGETTNAVQEARIARALYLYEDRAGFLAQLVKEIEGRIAYSAKRGFEACFRLNGTTDLPWERIPVIRNGKRYANMFRAFLDVQFYDYTKFPYAMRAHDIPNYHLTFSWAETEANHLHAQVWFEHGHNVAVVFGLKRNAALPETFNGWTVFNADQSDLRFKDRVHGVAGLHVKGNLWKHTASQGFVQMTETSLTHAA